jgi:hypothetical protein
VVDVSNDGDVSDHGRMLCRIGPGSGRAARKLQAAPLRRLRESYSSLAFKS